MKSKIYGILKRIYASTMMTSFFAGTIPIVPFIVAIMLGGDLGEKISSFLIEQYYPWVIILASISVLVGLIALYINKNYGFSVKEFKKDNKEDKNA